MVLRLANNIKNLETNYTLQFCIADIIKKQFIREEYYIDKYLELTDLIWK